MELIVARHEVHLQRQQRRTHEDIVQPGGVVADEEEGALDLSEILLEGVMYMVLGVDEQLPHQSQGVVDPVGMADLSRVDGFFNGYLFHISLSFPGQKRGPGAAQQNYHTTGQVLLSMLSFSNYFQGLLWKVTFHVSISLFHVQIYDILNKIRI